MKRNLLLGLILGIMLISFVSSYGYYNNFSLSDLLDEIDSETMILGAILVISLFFINLALSRFFKDEYGEPMKGIKVISLVIALLITWGINKTDFDFESIFYNMGFSEGFLYSILPIVLLIGAIILVIKFKFSRFLVGFGAFLIVISFTDFIYSKGLTLVIGIISLIVGFWFWKLRGRKEVGLPGRIDQYRDYRGQRREQKYDWRAQKYGQRLSEKHKRWLEKERIKQVRKSEIGNLKMEDKRPSFLK